MIAIIAFIVFLFNMFSNPRVRSYFSSLSIASSFWQAIFIFSKIPNISWPSAAHTGFEASNVIALQFDFLSPECLFRDLPYEIKFIGWCLSPLLIFALFVLYYLMAIGRNYIAGCIEARFKINFSAYYERSKGQGKLAAIGKLITNELLYSRNYIVWMVNRAATPEEIHIFRDNTICSFFVFIFFAYGNIISTTLDLFKCILQPDGTRTLVSSPDIVCYATRWWIMLPFSIVMLFLVHLLVFGIYLHLFVTLSTRAKLDLSFKRKFRFTLFRFKKSCFFWNAVLSMKQILITLCVVFMPPAWIIVFAVLIVFIMMLIHSNFVPYKKKFHNLYVSAFLIWLY